MRFRARAQEGPLKPLRKLVRGGDLCRRRVAHTPAVDLKNLVEGNQAKK